MPDFMKTRSVGTKLFHADRGRDKTKLTAAFRNSANAPQRVCVISYPHRILFCPAAKQPKSGLGRLIVDVSRSHARAHTHTNDRPALDE